MTNAIPEGRIEPNLTNTNHDSSDLAGTYSRRINIQHRIVYEVFIKEKTVRVLRMWTHYE